uniref:Tetratricopeptide TPR_2 repeat protein n=1 Tax=Geobacter sp. (strain M21) TaxID=443144 RepID=C6E7I8_GEOSM
MDRYARLNQALSENRVELANEICHELLRAEPENVELLTLDGLLAYRRGNLEEALQAFSRAAFLQPESAELRNNVGVAYQDLNCHDSAALHFREALSLRGEYPEARCNLATALLHLGDAEEAIRNYCDAIAAAPGYADAYHLLGNALRRQGEWEGAVQCYQKALELDPQNLKTLVNLGGSLFTLNRFDEAIAAQRRALSIDPDHVDAHWNLALVLLTTGNYQEGFREYQWRLKDPAAGFPESCAGKKPWDGTALCGRTLLLRCEQGFGDTIQFFRYAQLLARRGERVALECRSELLPLLASQEPAMTFFAASDPPPSFDCFAYLMSLPHLLGTRVDTIPPQEPPLRADPVRSVRWRDWIPGGSTKVGVVWAGSAGYRNDRYRSLPARALASLAGIPGVRLYNLQLPAAADDLAAIGEIRDLTGRIRDFSDTAALIEELDLVVSVDTAVAHLAAAMGKPVWLLLPFSCEWRWLSGRSDSPWYPSVTIYRQPSFGDWEGAVAAVAADLAAWPARAQTEAPSLPAVTPSADASEAASRSRPTHGAEAAPGADPAQAPLIAAPGEDDPNQEFRRANALRAAGELPGAVALYRRLLERLPACAEIHNNLGLALQDQGLDTEAEQSFRRALELKPELADAHNNLGTLLVARGEHEGALPFFEKALELREGYLPAYANLGSCLQVLEEPERAVELYRRAIALDPGFFEARINLGTAYQDLMQPEKAIEVYRELLELAPEHPEAHWNLALSLLSVGDFKRGWEEYEWRLASGEAPLSPLPYWRGEELSGQSILVECEQGLGDTLQFVRYLPLLAERGGEVLLKCQNLGLKPLLERVPGVAAVFVPGEEPPACSLRVKLLSLPHLFGTTLEAMPQWDPYLLADQRRATLWELLLDQGSDLKVGLVWRGGALPRNRACPFGEFAPLRDLKGVSWFSLQLGEAPDPGVLEATDLAPQIKDFGDSAAILSGLDLLLTVDTAAAHLAGGMGVPVWLMLPFSCDWRWMSGREDSPWYPTLRIFRQGRPGDWPGVVGGVRGALEEMLRRR